MAVSWQMGQVISYTVRVWDDSFPRLGYSHSIGLKVEGADSDTAFPTVALLFYPEGTALPVNTLTDEGYFVHTSHKHFSEYVDLLRNEGPDYVWIGTHDDGRISHVFGTGAEPPGEGELY